MKHLYENEESYGDSAVWCDDESYGRIATRWPGECDCRECLLNAAKYGIACVERLAELKRLAGVD